YGVDIDVPTPQLVAGTYTVNRVGETFQVSQSVGGGFGGLSASASGSLVTSNGVVDYIDMNGDGFPDVLGRSGVQYTSTRGTLSGTPANNVGVRPSDSRAAAAGLGGTAAVFRANERGRTTTTGTSPGKSAENGSQMAEIGINVDASLNAGTST